MKKNLLFLIGALFIALILFEALLRFFHYKPWIRSKPNEPNGVKANSAITGWFEPNEQFGWVYNRKKTSSDSAVDNQITYEGNELGFRDSEWSDSSNAADDSIKIMILGDSHTAGHGVPEDDRYSDLLQSSLGPKFQVFNFAVAGWGIDQMYLAFKTYFKEFQPQIVIFAYIPNDLLRSLESYRPTEQLEKPSFDLEHGSLKLRTFVSENAWAEYLLKHFYSVNFFYKTLYKPYLAKRINTKIAEEIVRLCRENDIKLVAVRIPLEETVKPANQLDDWLERFARWLYKKVYGLSDFLRENADVFIDPTQLFREQTSESGAKLYFEDGHINKAGHKFLAEILLPTVKRLTQ